MTAIDRSRLAELHAREQDAFGGWAALAAAYGCATAYAIVGTSAVSKPR